MEQSCQVDTKQEDQQSANLFDPFEAFAQVGLEFTGRDPGNGPEQNEDDRETDDEAERMQQDRHADLRGRVGLVELLERQSGDVGEVGRNQRQDTGGHEGEDPGREGNPVGDVCRLVQGLSPSSVP